MDDPCTHFRAMSWAAADVCGGSTACPPSHMQRMAAGALDAPLSFPVNEQMLVSSERVSRVSNRVIQAAVTIPSYEHRARPVQSIVFYQTRHHAQPAP
jgi:hypothetical protein